MRKSKSEATLNTINILLLCIISLVTLFPLYYVFVLSFTDPTEYLVKSGQILIPEKWSLASYRYLLSTSSFKSATLVSVCITVVGTFASLAVTSTLAYGLSRKRLIGRKVMLSVVLMTLFFNPGIIPNYLLVKELHLINNYAALILPVLTSGWYVILMKSFFDNIPAELEEAALLDGCTDITVFTKIILPLSFASLAAFGLLYAVGYWNSFFNAMLYMNDPEKWTIQVLLRNMIIESSTSTAGGGAATDSAVTPPAETLKMSAVILATLPILVVYPFLQKHFAKGVMLGSVKG
jgi:putative aldouronate transport system permease protein